MNKIARTLGAVFVFLLVAGLLIGMGAAIGMATGLFQPVDDTEAPQYDAEELYIEQLESNGTVDVSAGIGGEAGLVLIDTAHGNDVDDGTIDELRSALVAYGHEVRTVDDDMNFGDDLDNADALIVADPSQPYENDSAQAVKEFAADGGRVLLLGEPDQTEFDGRFLTPVDSEINTLASRLGVSFGADHLYDMDASDGNHRNVIVTPTDNEMMTDVDRAVISIGTHVSASDGEPLLETAPTAQRSAGETQGQYTVAVRNGSVLAIGDTSFLERDRFNVADNEELIAAIVKFLSGEYE